MLCEENGEERNSWRRNEIATWSTSIGELGVLMSIPAPQKPYYISSTHHRRNVSIKMTIWDILLLEVVLMWF